MKVRDPSCGPMTVRTVPMGPTGPKSMAAAVGLEKTRTSAERVRAVLGADTVGTVVADVEAVRVGVVTTGVGAGGPSTATVSVRLTQP